jgi:hypothetical protein
VSGHDHRGHPGVARRLQTVAEDLHVLAVGDDRQGHLDVVGGLADALEHLQVLEDDAAGLAAAHRHRGDRVDVDDGPGPGQRGHARVQFGLGGRLAAPHRGALSVDQHHVRGRQLPLVVAARRDREPQRVTGQHHGQVAGGAPHPAEGGDPGGLGGQDRARLLEVELADVGGHALLPEVVMVISSNVPACAWSPTPCS